MLRLFKKTISLAKVALLTAFLAVFLVACSGVISVPIEDLTRAKSTVKVVNGFVAPTDTADAAFLYQVKKGDTLYAIAWRFGWDYKTLATLNNIPPPYVIYVDEQIAFSAQGVTRKAPPVNNKNNAVATSNTNKNASKATSNTHTAPNKQSVQVATTTKANKPKVVVKPVENVHVVNKPIKNYVGDKNVGWQWPLRGTLLNKFNARSETSKGIDVQVPQGSPVKAAAKGQVVYAGNGLQGYGNLLILKHNDTYLSAYAYNSQLLVSEGDLVGVGQQVALSGKGPKFSALLHFEIRKDGKPVDPLKYLPK